MATNEEARSGARAVDRAVGVLNCFEGNDPELSVSELARRAGLPVSTTHRLAQALVRGRLLEQDHSTDRYRIGPGLAQLARPALSRLGLDSAAPHLYALAAGIRITVSVSIVEDREAVTVFQARPPVLFCPQQVPRPRAPLRTSAVGKALLAFSSVHTVMEEHAAQSDSRPVRSRALYTDLARIRRLGFASELIGTDDPIRSIAVPVMGPDRDVRGVLGVQARSARLDDQLVRGIVPAMYAIARRIGPLLGADTLIEFESR